MKVNSEYIAENKDEEKIDFEKIKNIKFINGYGYTYDNITDQDTFREAYIDFEKIIIPTQEDYDAFIDLVNKYVWSEDYYIPTIGIWYKINSEILSEKELEGYIKHGQYLLDL